MKPKTSEECGCCEVGPRPTPRPISNRPGLSAINYRVGTYISFRQAMIESIARRPELTDWTTRQSDDYGIALMEMWAYLADILTFYQERIANEAFLRTALHRDTVMRLAAMLDYRLDPGVAASTYLTFQTEEDKNVLIPIGQRVQSVPGQNEEPQIFETIESMEACYSLNELDIKKSRQRIPRRYDKSLSFKGLNTGLNVGDYILIVGEKREKEPGSEKWDLRKIFSISTDSVSDRTIVILDRPLGHRRIDFLVNRENCVVHAMRLIVWPFGVNAPDFRTLHPDIQGAYNNVNWTEIDNNNCSYYDVDELKDAYGDTRFAKKRLVDPINPNQILLDNIYETIVPGSWIALVMEEPPPQEPELKSYREAYYVKDVENTVAINYTLTSKVTKLTVEGVKESKYEDEKERIWPEHIEYFPMQGTMILAQSEELELSEIPISRPVSGDILKFTGYYPDLKKGQKLLIEGKLSDANEKKDIEVVTVSDLNSNNGSPSPSLKAKTNVTLDKNLFNSYERQSVHVYGNVAKATHGETVLSEVLGSGDASKAFQEFTLKKSPTTFIPDPKASHGADNTLEIRVGGVMWREVESFFGRGPNDQVYTARIDEQGFMQVRFGDGITGARLPSGQNNVVAKYRKGLGSGGNVQANSLTTLLDRPLGLKSATNPIQATGGTDSEQLKKARINAPNTVKTFGRAISLRDYEDLARSYTGIAKAKASIDTSCGAEIINLVIAGENGERIETTSTTYKNFVSYLDLHRDINQPLEVVPHGEDQLLKLKALIQVDPAYTEQNVLESAKKALLKYFSFDELGFGQGIHLSDIYALLQSVNGVAAVHFEYLDNKEETQPKAVVHISIDPKRIAGLLEDDLELEAGLFAIK